MSTDLPDSFFEALRERLPSTALLSEPGDCWAYGIDNSRRHHPPALVVLAENSEQVAATLALCHQYRIPVTPRGAGTGTAGAAVPIEGGVVLSTERMRRIIEVDPENRRMRVEPGVSNQQVQQAAAEHGFFWPPDPTSSVVCTIGGNLACNAAGPRAVKYGTPRENVLGLRAVSADGRALVTGVQTSKGVVGYDLTRLLVGSEGTLAVITEATLRLTPLPEARRTLRALYADMGAAARAVARIMAQPVTPCALEFLDGAALRMAREHGGAELPEAAGALLMIEVDGAEACLDAAVASVQAAAEGEGCLELRAARDEDEVSALWAVRKALSPALRHVAPKKINEDVVVPVSRIPALIDGIAELGERYGIAIVNFGHAGNGNIHVNLLVDPDDPQQMSAAESCLDELFTLVLSLDGSLSGEHGIGLVKRDFVARETDPVALELMWGIKQHFDPHGILNPGKKLPQQG